MVVNRSIGYRGDLIVVWVPKGSQWSLTLSDQPNFRAADADIPASDRGRRSSGACFRVSLVRRGGPEGPRTAPVGRPSRPARLIAPAPGLSGRNAGKGALMRGVADRRFLG